MIVGARISEDPRIEGYLTLHVKLDMGEEEALFGWYVDELSFTASEFIGLTVDEARKLRHDRDVAYLQS